jgi:hypothetical protein
MEQNVGLDVSNKGTAIAVIEYEGRGGTRKGAIRC